jgi:sulfatase modifying factor 1
MREDLLPRFVRIPGGEFLIGSDDGDDDERPVHAVVLDPFYIAAHAVTVAQYAEFTRGSGYEVPSVRDLPLVVTPAHETAFRELAAPYDWRAGEPIGERAQHPVTLVTFDDAVAYCKWLGERIGLPVRLPTEAEWESAARGGQQNQRYPWGDDVDGSQANFLLDPSSKRNRGTTPVGRYAENGYGLHDMAGNVWQWVADWYRPEYYRESERENPKGPPTGTLRVVRGGSWVTHDVRQLGCAHRHKVPPDTYSYSIGFRVAYSET